MGSLCGMLSRRVMVNFVRPVAPTRLANPPRGTLELENKQTNKADSELPEEQKKMNTFLSQTEEEWPNFSCHSYGEFPKTTTYKQTQGVVLGVWLSCTLMMGVFSS